jgi:hypothetical protein
VVEMSLSACLACVVLKEVSFSMDGMGRGKKVMVKSQFQHGEENSKIISFHGCTKHFRFTGIEHKSQFQLVF